MMKRCFSPFPLSTICLLIKSTSCAVRCRQQQQQHHVQIAFRQQVVNVAWMSVEQDDWKLRLCTLWSTVKERRREEDEKKKKRRKNNKRRAFSFFFFFFSPMSIIVEDRWSSLLAYHIVLLWASLPTSNEQIDGRWRFSDSMADVFAASNLTGIIVDCVPNCLNGFPRLLQVLRPWLKNFGIDFSLEVKRRWDSHNNSNNNDINNYNSNNDNNINRTICRGYYPNGGGEVEVVVSPLSEPIPSVDMTRPGDVVQMIGYSFAAGGLPLNVSFLFSKKIQRSH